MILEGLEKVGLCKERQMVGGLNSVLQEKDIGETLLECTG